MFFFSSHFDIESVIFFPSVYILGHSSLLFLLAIASELGFVLSYRVNIVFFFF